jgi:hypothetical protein
VEQRVTLVTLGVSDLANNILGLDDDRNIVLPGP